MTAGWLPRLPDAGTLLRGASARHGVFKPPKRYSSQKRTHKYCDIERRETTAARSNLLSEVQTDAFSTLQTYSALPRSRGATMNHQIDKT